MAEPELLTDEASCKVLTGDEGVCVSAADLRLVMVRSLSLLVACTLRNGVDLLVLMDLLLLGGGGGERMADAVPCAWNAMAGGSGLLRAVLDFPY